MMKAPTTITIFVAVSLLMDIRHSIDLQFETLVRKILIIFAENPSKFAPVHSSQLKEMA